MNPIASTAYSRNDPIATTYRPSMSRRLKIPGQNLSAFELPLLPFLAPRIFTPWPSSFSRRSLSTKNALSKQEARPHAVDKLQESAEHIKYGDQLPEDDLERLAIARVIESMGSGTLRNTPEERRASGHETTERKDILDRNEGGLASGILFGGSRDGTAEGKKDFDQIYIDTWGAAPDPLTIDTESSATRRHQSQSARRDQPSRDAAARFKESYRTGSNRSDLKNTGASDRSYRVPTYASSRPSTAENPLADVESFSPNRTEDASPKLLPAAVKFRAHRVLAAKDVATRYRIRPVRTSYQPLPLDSKGDLWISARLWSTAMAKLNMPFDPRMKPTTQALPPYDYMAQRTASASVSRFAHELSLALTSADVRRLWREQDSTFHLQGAKHDRWAVMILEVLKNYPESALKILIATFDSPSVPSYAITDCMEYITSFHIQNGTIARRQADAEIIQDAIKLLLFQQVKEPIFLTQKTMFLLSKSLVVSKLGELYDDLQAKGQYMHENTLLHFASRFAKCEYAEKAFGILRMLHQRATDFTSPAVESVCATLLRKTSQQAVPFASDSEIFSQLLEMGLRPNIIFYNILLHNSAESGDHETAWKVYDMMVETRIEPDEFSYSILLNDAKRRLDRSTVDRIFQMIRSKDIQNAHIITDLMHAIYALHEADIHQPGINDRSHTSYSSTFDQMLRLFCVHFDTQVLDLLLPSHVLRRVVPPSSETKPLPSVQTLVVILVAYIRRYEGFQHTQKFYSIFRSLVVDRHPLIVPLADTTHIYDAVIAALGLHAEGVSTCGKIVSDMLSSTSNSTLLGEVPTQLTEKHRKGSVRTTHCLPNVRTWSILLKVYQDHNQPLAAEKVLELMQARGIQPNQVTWNTLVAGYAKTQDIPNTTVVLEKMEAAGFKADSVTMKALQWIKNRPALQKSLEDITLRKKRKDQAVSIPQATNVAPIAELVLESPLSSMRTKNIESTHTPIPAVSKRRKGRKTPVSQLNRTSLSLISPDEETSENIKQEVENLEAENKSGLHENGLSGEVEV